MSCILTKLDFGILLFVGFFSHFLTVVQSGDGKCLLPMSDFLHFLSYLDLRLDCGWMNGTHLLLFVLALFPHMMLVR